MAMHPSAYRNQDGIWIDPSDPAYDSGGATDLVFGCPEGVDPDSLPPVYLFSNSRDGDGIAYSMCDDGVSLGGHWCSHWGYMNHDLHDHESRRSAFREKYPNGYRLKILGPGELPPEDVLEKNRLLGVKADAEKEAASNGDLDALRG